MELADFFLLSLFLLGLPLFFVLAAVSPPHPPQNAAETAKLRILATVFHIHG